MAAPEPWRPKPEDFDLTKERLAEFEDAFP
jgi:hypothetical protein